MAAESITSSRNQRLRDLKRLQQRKHRREQGLFVAEGEDMVAEALRHGTVPQTVFSVERRGAAFLAPGWRRARGGGRGGSECGELAGLRIACDRRLGVPPARELERATESAVYLHDVADPGNVGTVLRAALPSPPTRSS